MTDGELMARFAGDDGSSGAAFEALVGRHGPMVLRVCRQMLGDPHDAQDAFQATFLVLACKAESVRKYDSAASWLHGVALRVAGRSLRDTARRRANEKRCAERKPVESIDEVEPTETWQGLHEEIASLPESLRLPVVLCYLEGMTAEAAAHRLGCPRGTVLSRLSRARERLRHRLTRRGLAFPAGFLTTGLASAAAEAAVPAILTRSVVQSALQIAAGDAVALAAPAPVAALTGGVLKSMAAAKGLVIGATTLLSLGGVALTAFVILGMARGGANSSRAGNDREMEVALKAWEASAGRIGGSLKLRVTSRRFLEVVPAKGGESLKGRPSMRDRSVVAPPQYRKRPRPWEERSIVLSEFTGDRFRVKWFCCDADFPASPKYTEAWDGDRWKVRDSGFGVIASRPNDGQYFRPYGLPYAVSYRDVEPGISYQDLIRQRECTFESDGRLYKIHAPEREGVHLNLTYFTFWLDPSSGMLPVRIERGTKGNPPETRIDVDLEQVKPGLWAPMRIRTRSYNLNAGPPTYGEVFSQIDHVVEKTSARFGAALDPSTFTLTFPPGLRIIDRVDQPPPRNGTR